MEDAAWLRDAGALRERTVRRLQNRDRGSVQVDLGRLAHRFCLRKKPKAVESFYRNDVFLHFETFQLFTCSTQFQSLYSLF